MRKGRNSAGQSATRSARQSATKSAEREKVRVSTDGRSRAREGPPKRSRGGVAPAEARAPHPRSPAPRPAGASLPAATAVDMLQRAMQASTPRSRGIWARRGLALPRRIDRTTRSMLLRQLYLAHYEERRFQKAAEVADQIIKLQVLPDVAHQDAARAKQALGDVDAAAGHLRLAARLGPAKRKAFHWWTLGSLYFLAHRYAEAITAMTRAARWGTTDKPLYQGHLAVVRCASGQRVPDLATLIDRLAEAPSGQGYGRFVLGQMAFYDGRHEEARRYLEAFVKRSVSSRKALELALEGEIEIARQTLAALAKA